MAKPKRLQLSPEQIDDLSDRMVPVLKAWALQHGLMGERGERFWITAEFSVDEDGGVYRVIALPHPSGLFEPV